MNVLIMTALCIVVPFIAGVALLGVVGFVLLVALVAVSSARALLLWVRQCRHDFAPVLPGGVVPTFMCRRCKKVFP